jgi:uncharacterized protein
MMNTTILWHDRDTLGAERCTLRSLESGFRLAGIALCPADGVPLQVAYTVDVDADWRTRHVVVHVDMPHAVADLALSANGAGAWWSQGAALSSVAGCLDVDLSITPATNTLPIRRLRLQPGDIAQIGVAWVAFPSLRIVRSEQQYECLAVGQNRFRSGTYSAHLVVDAEGLVHDYEGAWRAIAQG